MDRERDRDLSVVWHAANLNRKATDGKLPNLKDLLRQARGMDQTLGEQRSAIYQLSANLGIPLKPTRLIRKAS